MNNLSVARKQRLRTLENEIRSGMEEFYYTGMKLKEIRDDELYKEDGFTSFERYVWDRFQYKKRYLYDLIRSSEYRALLPSPQPCATAHEDDEKPRWTEASVRELTRIPDKKEAARVAKKVIEKVEKEEGAKLTSTLVRKVVDEELGVKRGKPAPEPEPEEQGETVSPYLVGCTGRLEAILENLQGINEEGWMLLNRSKPGLVKRFTQACERLAGFLRKVDDERY